MTSINWHPDARQLRQFGLIALVVLPLLAWWWSGGNRAVIGVAVAVGGLFGLLALARPQGLWPAFVGLSLVAWPIGMVVGELALLVIYLGVITPLGLMLKCCGRDALARRFDRQAASYWQEKSRPTHPQSYRKQW
jgi:hypothetical protein